MEVSGQLHAPGALPPGERAPGSHWIGGWIGPRAGLDAVEKRKSLHCRESNPGRPARRYTDWAIPTPTDTHAPTYKPLVYYVYVQHSYYVCKAGESVRIIKDI
jgi:hypothetical protein